jgi:photosynthetic reaction center cytochrome c subunit
MDRVKDLAMGSRRRLVERFDGAAARHAKHFAIAFCFVALIFGCISLAVSQESGGAKLAPQDSQIIPQQIQMREPTGAERCVVCHPGEVQGFARSAMAHALRRPGKEPDGTVTAHGSTITMHSSAAGFYQSWENGGDKSDYRVDYVIGSGEHASGYLVDIGGHLFQSPVAYYKSRQAYDLAPGYEHQPDPDFTRPIAEECLLCHSGNALHVSGTLNEYRAPVFAAEAITCARCHGPVEKHLADPRAGTIVNPSKLEPAARDSVCEQCHLFGVARVANVGKKIGDFIPGRPLEETFTIYRNVMPAGAPAGDFKVISHVEQLALSACARNSGGKLWCVTCHNPHEGLAQSVEYYRARCLSCHATKFPAAHPAKGSDCLGCHMPRRDAKDGGHTVFTDHRIQRVPDTPRDLPADSSIAAWREPAPELQKRNLGIAYIDVGMQRHSAPFVIQGYRDLTEVQAQFTEDPDFFKWIGEALLLAKQKGDAKLAFDRALQLDPDSALTEASAAAPYIEEGDDADAIAHLERAVKLDPLFLPAASTLIGLYGKEGKSAEAAELSGRIKAAMGERPNGEEIGEASSGRGSGKKTEEVFKNIQVLKGIPSEQLIPAMEFMASSLGAECSFCHVEGHFDKDDKKEKQTAREMMKMMFAINGDFEGPREVTCYSCHRGEAKPVATPAIENGAGGKAQGGASQAQTLPTGLPTADEVVEKYVAALGGAAAIQKVTSRVEKGKTVGGGKNVDVEILTEAPDKWALVRHLPDGQSSAVYDGHSGWYGMPGRSARAMHPGDVEAARMDADLQFPVHIQEKFPELHVEYPETINGRGAYVLFASRDGQPAAKFYFDEQSGLLVRVVRYAESPLGLNPSQVDYADYREVDGVRVPFRVTTAEPGDVMTIQFEEIRQNVGIDNGVFREPGDLKHP